MTSQKPSNQIELSADIEIEANRSAIYEALNLRSPNNRYLRRGFSLTPQAAASGDKDCGRFVMVMPNLPHLDFFMSEQEAIPHERYVVHCAFTPDQPVGILTGDHSAYKITPIKDGVCRLSVDIAFQTIKLSKKGAEKHAAMLIISVHDDLARLKALIEDGAKAAEKAGALDEMLDELEGIA